MSSELNPGQSLAVRDEWPVDEALNLRPGSVLLKETGQAS